MKFLSLDDMTGEKPDIEFKESSGGKLFGSILSGVILLLALASAFGLTRGFRLPVFPAAVIVLFFGVFFALAFSTYRKTLSPANWLVRIGGDTVWIKYRTYQNLNMPRSEPQIIELNRAEIAGTNQARVRRITEGMGDTRHSTSIQQETDVYLEIALRSGDLAELKSHLEKEANHCGVGAGSGKAKMIDNPVMLSDDGILNVRWKSSSSRVIPPVSEAVKLFESWGIARPETRESIDFTAASFRKLDPVQQAAKLRELKQIDPFAATAAVQRLFGVSMSKATEMLDALDGRDSIEDSPSSGPGAGSP